MMSSEPQAEQARAAKGSRKGPWYVIQVPTGKEGQLCRVIERAAPEGVVAECFTPRYSTQIKRAGEWVDVEKTLLPGYLIVITRDLPRLVRTLRLIPEFTRVLNMGESFVPLTSAERAWIEAFTHEGDRCVEMSMGVMEGDRVVVVSGPLVGHEALITKLNRHRSLAYVELEICGRRVTTKVGLGIVSRKEDIPKGRGEHPRS